MRILIGYNGTLFAREAIEDLVNAGLPEEADALVLTVAEICFPTVRPGEAGRLAFEGAERVRKLFPKWKVDCESTTGPPVREIVAASERFGADLVVLGEVGKKDDHPMFLGPVSQGLLTNGKCALRISRESNVRPDRPLRLLIGFDGSSGSANAVSTIAKRGWPSGTKVRVVSVETPGVLGAIGKLAPQMQAAALGTGFSSKWAETLAKSAVRELMSAGLETSVEVRCGSPKQALVEAADEWEADCIFVAPHCSGNSYERFLLGSVSAAVAAHADCSVEIVRG